MQFEFVVLGFFDDYLDLIDVVVDSVYEEFVKCYCVEVMVYEYKLGKLDGLWLELYDILLLFVEMLVGWFDNVMLYVLVSVQVMQDVFKWLCVSIKCWGKVGGWQVYLNFIGG